MRRLVILAALVSMSGFLATALKAEEAAKDETVTVGSPCEGFGCSGMSAAMAKAMRNMPSSMPDMPRMMEKMPGAMAKMPAGMAKMMENFKPQDLKLPGCEGGKCGFEPPAR